MGSVKILLFKQYKRAGQLTLSKYKELLLLLRDAEGVFRKLRQ